MNLKKIVIYGIVLLILYHFSRYFNFPIYYLPVILKSLELDGWLSRREINELLELSSGLKSKYINFGKLEALWGEPFKTIRMFFYGKGILIENGKPLSFWISPLFATLSAALVALLHKDVLVIAWMNIFNSNQKISFLTFY